MVNIVKSRKCGVTSAKVTANIKPKRNGSRKKRGNPEEQQTIAFVQHMRQFYPETFKMIHHTPNESKYAYKPDSGVKPGVPDFFLAIMRGEYGGLFIEFKAPGRENEKNGGLSDEQVIAMD